MLRVKFRSAMVPRNSPLKGVTVAIKQVVVSDLSGKEIADDKHARIVIEDHPDINSPVELDVSTAEANKLQTTKIDLVTLTIHEPDARPRKVVLQAAAFADTFKDVDLAAVIAGARKAETGPARGRTRKASTSASAAKIDYTDPNHFGQLHRGRVTEEEAAMVRENLDQANKNRAAAGQDPIDPNDEKEKKRYGF